MVLRRIVAVADEFSSGTRAVQAGALIAAAARAELSVLRLIEDPWPFIEPGEVETKRALRGDAWQIVATARVGDEIRRLASRFGVSPARVTPLVRFGHPAIEIARAAEDGQADLIVLGAAAPGVIDDIMLRARVPCLIVPPEWRGWDRVVVWGEVYRDAFAFAALFGSDVLIVDAEPELVVAGTDGAETTARKAFAVWAKLPGTGRFDVAVRQGDAATQALAVTRSERADVLVISYPCGVGAPKVQASVALAIAQRAPCAVLLVPV